MEPAKREERQARRWFELEPPVPQCWCGNFDGQTLWQAHYNRCGDVNYAYSVIRCTNCSQVRTDPCPAGGATKSLYQGYGQQRLEKNEAEVRQWFVGRLADLRRFTMPPSRVLDVGCSTGTFVAMLAEAGYRAEGLEIDEFSINHARASGLDVRAGDLESTALEPNSYDVVVMSHTLEHLPNPCAAIRVIRRILTPGGVLLVYVPNFRSLAARVLRNKWGSLTPHEHVWHFSFASLRSLVASGSADALRPVWFHANTRLEPEDAPQRWKHYVKKAALRSAAAAGFGDEIRAAFRKSG
jgi:SAM-dependent methyltransferase